MSQKCLNLARSLVKSYLNYKAKNFIPEYDFVKKLLNSKSFELEDQGCQLTPEDIELLSTRRFSVEEICRFYGVPSVLVNSNEGTTTLGSSIEQIVEGFYRFGLRPFFERIEESIRLNLLERQDWDRYEFEFKIKDLLRASITTRIQNNRVRLESGQATINQIHQEEGEMPVPWGDQTFIGANLITIERAVQGQQGDKNE